MRTKERIEALEAAIRELEKKVATLEAKAEPARQTKSAKK